LKIFDTASSLFASLLSYRFDSLRFFREANQSDKKRSKEKSEERENQRFLNR